MHSIRMALVLVLAIASLALAACGDDDDATTDTAGGGGDTTATAPPPGDDGQAQSGSTPAPSGDAALSEKVEIVEFTYEPDPVTIEEGGKVIWINRDSAPHTATADDGSFDTETLEEGKLKSESFKEPGSYPYFCEIHPSMRGTVEVVPSG
jgi:plastocyanin